MRVFLCIERICTDACIYVHAPDYTSIHRQLHTNMPVYLPPYLPTYMHAFMYIPIHTTLILTYTCSNTLHMQTPTNYVHMHFRNNTCMNTHLHSLYLTQESSRPSNSSSHDEPCTPKVHVLVWSSLHLGLSSKALLYPYLWADSVCTTYNYLQTL